MRKQIKNDYDKWLVNLVCEWLSNYGVYSKLVSYLNTIEFYSNIEFDENRIADGKEIRLMFAEAYNDITYRDIYLQLYSYPASLLEIMVALAYKCEEQIMFDQDVGMQVGRWINDMLISSGLDIYDDYRFDAEAVQGIADRILNHTYDYNGNGGLYSVNNPVNDMRTLELWKQMYRYINELMGI